MKPPTSRKSNPDRGPGQDAESCPDAPSPADLRAYATRLLSHREYGRQELATRLDRKWSGAPGAEARIAACVDELVEEGLLSDHRFAESFVRSRRRRGQGPIKIRAELQQRRVDADAIAGSLEDDDEAWVREAADWLQRHAPRGVGLDRDGRARYYRRLTSRGFSHAQAMDALDRYARQSAADETEGYESFD